MSNFNIQHSTYSQGHSSRGVHRACLQGRNCCTTCDELTLRIGGELLTLADKPEQEAQLRVALGLSLLCARNRAMVSPFGAQAESETYNMEEVVGLRAGADGIEVLVKWQGGDHTWEPFGEQWKGDVQKAGIFYCL